MPLRKGNIMKKYFASELLSYRDIFEVPLKYVDNKEKNDSDESGAKIPVREKDSDNNFIVRHMTVDEEKYADFRAENEHVMKYITMQNIITIKRCAVFFVVLSLIEIFIGFLLLLH